MIITIKGKVKFQGLGYLAVDVLGIGYQVFVNSKTLTKIPQAGKTVELFVHQHIRENQLDLYGFLTLGELEVFELLLSISGIGPKAGLAILARATPEDIKKAIVDQNVDLFISVSGIGRKMAYKIIVELKDKISSEDLSIIISDKDLSEAGEALKNLGYQTSEIKKILTKLPRNLKLPEEQIRWALKKLGK